MLLVLFSHNPQFRGVLRNFQLPIGLSGWRPVRNRRSTHVIISCSQELQSPYKPLSRRASVLLCLRGASRRWHQWL